MCDTFLWRVHFKDLSYNLHEILSKKKIGAQNTLECSKLINTKLLFNPLFFDHFLFSWQVLLVSLARLALTSLLTDILPSCQTLLSQRPTPKYEDRGFS